MCSPQYHLVFDDMFTTTKTHVTNTLPSNWQDIFTHNSINLLEGEPLSDIAGSKLSAEWHGPIDTNPYTNCASDIDDNIISVSEGDQLVPPMTTVPEGALLPIVTDTEADPLTPMRHNKGTDSDRPQSGWNDSHPHNMQFRNHLQANGCFNVGPMDTLLDQFSPWYPV